MDQQTSRKDTIKIMDKAISDFVNEMTFVVNAMFEKNKKDNDIIEIRDGYMVAKRENPDCILKLVGPYFWKYRADITSGKMNDLLKNDYKDDIMEAQGSLVDTSNFDKIQSIMSKIKRTWHLFTIHEQEILKGKFIKMVSIYATYVGGCKYLEKLDSA